MNYSKCLSVRRQTWARETKIACGWNQKDIDGDTQPFLVGCEECNIFISVLFDCTKHKGKNAEDLFELEVKASFSKLANNVKCPHWVNYLRQINNKSVNDRVETITVLDMMMKDLGRPN